MLTALYLKEKVTKKFIIRNTTIIQSKALRSFRSHFILLNYLSETANRSDDLFTISSLFLFN